MLNALVSISELFANLIPKRVVATPDQYVVVLKSNTLPTVKSGEAFWYWPFWTAVKVFPKAVEPVNLSDQNVITAGEPQNLTFDVIASYRVVEPIMAAISTTDLVGQLNIEVNRCAVRAFAGKSLTECVEFIHGDGVESLAAMANEAVRPFGVRITSLDFGQYAVSHSVKHWTFAGTLTDKP